MSLFSVAERLAAIDRSRVKLDPNRCLHSFDRFNTCQACFGVCPVGAIQAGEPPALDPETCLNCLACLPVCPVDAYSADDVMASMLTCAARLEDRRFELVCQVHPAAEYGCTDAGIRVRGCLAGLSVAAYLGLAVLDLDRVVIRTDACANCPLSSLMSRIESQVEQARRFLAFYGKANLITCLDRSTPEEVHDRPLWDSENPPLSRRDLFRVVSRQGQVAVGRAMTKRQTSTGNQSSRQRQRLLSVLAHLKDDSVDGGPSLQGMGFALISVTEACTACGACFRICPTGALGFDQGEQNFSLSFVPQACIACESCLHVCAPDSIRIHHAPAFAQVFSHSEPVILLEGEISRCERCGVRFAAKPGKYLCPVCEFRQKKPFGSQLPPGFKGGAAG